MAVRDAGKSTVTGIIKYLAEHSHIFLVTGSYDLRFTFRSPRGTGFKVKSGGLGQEYSDLLHGLKTFAV